MISPKNRLVTILLLGLLSAVAPFSIDMYLPGFPAIANDLRTSVDAVSYSLASFFVGVCIGQLICGPLLDRYGRKRPLLIGLGMYLLASVGCALSTTIQMLIGFRLFQALGGCVGMVAPRAIVRDIFPIEENAKVMSLLILVLGVSPILAPSAGSYVIAQYGWPYVFLVLALLVLAILLAVLLWLPESKGSNPDFSLRLGPIFSSYLAVLKEPQFYTYALTGGICSAGLFAYLSGSPFVFMTYFGASESAYGIFFAIMAMGLILSSQLNTILLRKYSSQQLMKCMLYLQACIGATMVVASSFQLLTLYGTICLLFLYLGCQGFCFPNSAALSMAPFKREAGSASALMGALQMGLGAIAAALVGFLDAQTPVPMTAVMAGCSLLGVAMLRFGKQRMEKSPVPHNFL